MSNTQKQDLFQKIHSQIVAQQYELIDSTVNEILKVDPLDQEAQQIKVANLLHRGQYQSCLEYCRRVKGFEYEICYCLYRLNEYEQALQLLPKDSMHLKFQILYRLQKIEIPYEQTKDEEIITNILAALFVSQQFATALEWIPKHSTTSFELAYNVSMIYLGLQQFERALEWIEKSKQICSSQFKDVPDTFLQEYPVILLQEAYIYESMNQLDKAQSIYKSIVTMQTNDVYTLAIANMNLTILHSNDASLYELQKHVKSAEKIALSKWTWKQWEMIQRNHLILLLNMKKFDECRELLVKFKQEEEVSYLKAIVLFREKKIKEAREVLSTQSTIKSKLTLIQMDLFEGKEDKAVEAMKQLVYSNHFKLGLLSSYINLVSKYVPVQERMNSIFSVLQDAVESIKEVSHLFLVMTAQAQLLIEYEQYKQAAQVLEMILEKKYYSNEQERLECISNLVNAYFNFDSKKAEQYVQELPNIPIKDLSLDKLEFENSLLSQRKKLSKEMQDMIIGGSEEKKKKQLSRHKKRRNKKPKHYDPKKQPDPERWLPKKERTVKKPSTTTTATATGGSMRQMAASQGATAVPLPQVAKNKGKPIHKKKK